MTHSIAMRAARAIAIAAAVTLVREFHSASVNAHEQWDAMGTLALFAGALLAVCIIEIVLAARGRQP
jgi:hypothetical protein